jgi:hypothetical protein
MKAMGVPIDDTEALGGTLSCDFSDARPKRWSSRSTGTIA